MESTARIILAVLLCFTMPVYGTVTPIKKGEIAPYDGFIFDHDSERQASKYRDDAIFFEKLGMQYSNALTMEQANNTILEKRLQLYINQSNLLLKDRNQTETTQRLYLIGAFALGVIATGLIVRNVHE